MQSAAQRRSSSKNLRNCENIANMASGYENWRSRLIFNMLSTALWRGWEMLRVRLRFRMKGRVWYHLGNWGSWSSIPISDLVYTDAVVARPGTSENACMAPPQEPNQTWRINSCLALLAESTKSSAEICWTIVNTAFNIIRHTSTSNIFWKFHDFHTFVFHSATPLAYGNGGAALQLWGRKSWRRASLSACACHDRDITLRLLICGGEKMCFYLFSWTKV